MTADEKQLILESHKLGSKELKDWFEAQQMSQRDAAFVINISKYVQLAFEKNTNDMTRDVSKQQAETDSEKKLPQSKASTLWSLLGTLLYDVAKVLVALGRKLVSVGWSLTKCVFQHPKTTKMIAFLALQIKKAICRELSIAMGRYRYRKAKGILETVSDGIKNATDYAAVTIPDIISNFGKYSLSSILFFSVSHYFLMFAI